MTKQRLLFFIGIWVAVLPFLGFPSSIRKVFFLMTGLGIILLSYFMYIQVKAIKEMDEKGGGIFVKEKDLPKEEPVSTSLETSEPISEELSQSDIDDQNEII